MALKFEEKVDLKRYSSMRVGGTARYLVHVKSKNELVEAVEFAANKNISFLAMGGGTNTVFSDNGYNGLVIINDIKGIEFLEKNDNGAIIRAHAGEVWDDLVKTAVDKDLSGIEAMSIVPGNVGAAAVQNIGCYGQELSETFIELEAYDTKNKTFVTISKDEAGFRYRSSIFRFDHPKFEEGRYVIVSITLKLKYAKMRPPFYRDVEKYFEEHGIDDYTPQNVREAIIEIRTKKLPDPNKVPNTGSFFKNPVVTKEKFEEIEGKVPSINETPLGWPQPPRWFLPDGTVKIAAGRLVELAGFSAYEDQETGMATWPRQNLTLVNKSAKSAEDVVKFRDKIIDAVREKFGIELEPEVRILA